MSELLCMWAGLVVQDETLWYANEMPPLFMEDLSFALLNMNVFPTNIPLRIAAAR